MNDFVLGKYVHKDTPIHRLDPRVKVFGMILIMVAALLGYGTFLSTFIFQGLLLIFILTLVFVSKIKISAVFKSLKLIWFTLIFILIINVLVPHNNYSYELVRSGNFVIYLESIFQSIKIFIRIFTMILMTLILTSTTKSLDIAFAFEWFLSPLKLIRFPVSNLALVMSLALRFIPLILEETQKIKKAQESRGVEFERGNIFKRIKVFASILVPLMVSSYETSIQMADAMEVRGFIPNQKRTKYAVRKFSLGDSLALIFLVVCCSGFYFISWANYDLLDAMFKCVTPITVLR